MANNSKNEHSRVFSVSKDEKGINTVDREPNECHKAVKAEPSQAAATLTMALPSNREDAIVPFELLPTSRDPIRKRVNGDITRPLTQRPRYNPPPYERHPEGGSSPGRPYHWGKQVPTCTDHRVRAMGVQLTATSGYGQYRWSCQPQGHASSSKKRLEGALPPASTDSNGG